MRGLNKKTNVAFEKRGAITFVLTLVVVLVFAACQLTWMSQGAKYYWSMMQEQKEESNKEDPTTTNIKHKKHNWKTNAHHCPPKAIESIPIRSFKSQSKEDRTLLSWFKGLCNGTYIEMGALDGLRFSNTFLFQQEFDWKGVLIELNPGDYSRLKVNRPKDKAIHAAVCDKRQMVHYLSANRETPNHLVEGVFEFMAPEFRKKFWPNITMTSPNVLPIECVPMKDLLEENVPEYQYFDFYSLDVHQTNYPI